MFVRISYVVTEQNDATSCSISEMLYEMLGIDILGKPSEHKLYADSGFGPHSDASANELLALRF